MGFFSRKADTGADAGAGYEAALASYESGDLDAAFNALRPLAKRGHPESQILLGRMYERGEGTLEDPEAAIRWYRACPLPEALFRHGEVLIRNNGIFHDTNGGIELYMKAAEAGHAPACAVLGRMFEKGDRVPCNPGEAFRLYRLGAEAGDAMCQHLLAQAYRNGTGTVRSTEETVRWTRLAADQGLPEAVCSLADMHSVGDGVERSPEKAETLYLSMAEKGHMESQRQLAWMYQTGALGDRDADAMRWYRAAAEQGDATAMNNIGVMYEDGRSVARIAGEAAAWYRKASDAESHYGMFNLGRCHAEGIGVPQDDVEAVRYLLMSADRRNILGMQYLSEMIDEGRGARPDSALSRKWAKQARAPMNARVQFAMGWQYEKGVQVPRSEEQSVRWYGIAAGNGSSAAQCNMGLRYEQGRGVPTDYGEAFRWYLKAADNGNSNAQYNVALMYDKGRGVEQSDEQAVRYYTRSADNGNASAQCALGQMYETGRGVQSSEEEAFRLYTLALRNGNKDAARHLRRLQGEDDEEEEQEEERVSDAVKIEDVKAVQETFSKFRPVPDTGVDFSMVKGLDDVKEEINNQILQPYTHPDVYRRFRKKIGGGILLYGPPGTGKTMIAQAIATETHAVFFSVKCSDILSRWTGEAVANIRKLFTLARKQPRAVIFFDEFEALGRARTDDSRSWEDSLMAELLSQIQGFDQYDTNLIILAATNRPWDIDNALLRSGRFSRHIYVPLPDDDSRRAIIETQLDGVPVGPTFDLEDAVRFTAGFNGADVVELCEQMKQSAINRSIRLSSDSEVISAEDAEFGKARTKCSVSASSTKRLEEFREAGF